MIDSFDFLPQRCEHPVRIPDRSKPGHFLYVPCGHCKSCLTNRRNSWQSKLYAEAKVSAAVMFFTLTYDNKHLPVVRVVNDTTVLYKHRLINFKATDYDVNSFHPITSYADRQAFAVCSKKDVQNFFKRLRRRLSYDAKGLLPGIPQSDRSFRYFVVSEYGPQTYRPHYHGLLFFNSVSTFRAASRYIYDAWKFCSPRNLDCTRVASNAPGYVSKYVCKSSGLPSILTYPAFAPFYLFSRRPSLGSLLYDSKTVFDNIYNRSIQHYQTVVSRNGTRTSLLPDFRGSLLRLFTKPLGSYRYGRNEILSFIAFADANASEGFCLKCSEVGRRHGLDTYNSYGHKLTWSDIHDDLTEIELIFGVPQNRRFYKNYLRSGLTPVEYTDLYFSVYSQIASNSLRSNSESFQYLIDLGFSRVNAFTVVYSNFRDLLPVRLDSVSMSDRLSLDLILDSFQLSLSDFFGRDGFRKESVFRYDFSKSRLYLSYLDSLTSKEFDFERGRLLVHNNNVLNSHSYEAF